MADVIDGGKQRFYLDDGAGNILGNAGNPMNVTGSFAGSLGVIGAAAPASATAIGFTNAAGNLSAVSPAAGFPIMDAYAAPSAVNWTTGGTVVNTAATANTAGMDTVIVTLVANASVTGGVVIFEVYDGATWLPVKAPTIIDYTTVGLVTLTASYSKGFQVPVAGFPQFRVRLSTVLSGAGGQLTVTTVVSSAPDVSLVTVGLDPAQPLPAGTNNLGLTSPANNPVGSAAFAASQATVGTSGALIVAARTGAIGTGRIAATIYNNGTATIFVGTSTGVLTTTGFPVAPGAALVINTTAALYGISTVAAQNVGVLETF